MGRFCIQTVERLLSSPYVKDFIEGAISIDVL